MTPVDSVKDVVRSSMKVPKFDKHLKKARGHISQNVVEINNKDEDNSPKTLNDKNHQALSQKFRLQIFYNFIFQVIADLLILFQLFVVSLHLFCSIISD